MPKLKYHNYSFSVASDDFVYASVYNVIWRLFWFITILVLTIQSESEIKSCKDGIEWFILYIFLTLLLIILSINIQIIIGYTSIQGTMTNIKPRENMGLYLIIHLIICICHFLLSLIGVIFILIDARPCHDSTIYTDEYLLLFVIFTQLIDTTLTIMYILWLNPKKIETFNDNNVDNENGDGNDNDNDNVKVNSLTLWENRLRSVCCILHRGCCNVVGGNFVRGKIDDVVQLLHQLLIEIGQVNLTLSDVSAGIVLVHLEQRIARRNQRKSALSSTTTTTNSNAVDSDDIMVDMTDIEGESALDTDVDLTLIDRYGTPALSIYSVPLYLYMTKCTGLCRLCTGNFFRSCVCWDSSTPPSIHQDNYCQIHKTSINEILSMREDVKFDLAYASVEDTITMKPYAIQLDKEMRTIIVVIRGTMSLEDCVTDLLIDPQEMHEAGKRWGFDGEGRYCHRGFLQSTLQIRKDIEDQGILKFLYESGEYTNVVVAGHSMGAAIASILAYVLKPIFPNTKAFCYACPATIFDERTCDDVKPYITCVGYHNDWVLGISRHSLLELRDDIVDAINRCKTSKYQVFSALCNDYIDKSETLLHPKGTTGKAIDPIKVIAVKPTKIKLYTPGRIVHIIRVGYESSRGIWGTKKKGIYKAIERKRSDFDKILLSTRMFLHHIPDVIMRKLQRLAANK